MASSRYVLKVLKSRKTFTDRVSAQYEFVRAFIEGIVVQPDKLRLDLQIRKIPALEPGNSTCLMVAGARYEAVQMDLNAPSQLFVAKHRRFVAWPLHLFTRKRLGREPRHYGILHPIESVVAFTG
jgi:hypothetical protein